MMRGGWVPRVGPWRGRGVYVRHRLRRRPILPWGVGGAGIEMNRLGSRLGGGRRLHFGCSLLRGGAR